MVAQKPGFFTKYLVTYRKLGKKPGFFNRSVSRTIDI